jgi:hypothetical protein
MRRYLSEAFWARPEFAGLGRVPWNALFVAGAVILGLGEHAVWFAGAALETIYLYSLVTSTRFQHWVDAKETARLQDDSAHSRERIAETLGDAQKRRLAAVEEKCKKVEQLYGQTQNEDFLYDSNREALHKLTWLYMRLLVAQRNLQMLDVTSRESDLRGQIAGIGKELAGTMSDTLRDSKKATLGILNQRLRNLQRRTESLAEIDSDLTRIEQQVDLAAEDASLKGRPAAIFANIDLVSHLLDDSGDLAPLVSEPATTTTTSSSSSAEIEH